ncbi:MAG TPA: MDR family MFS transporter [Nocardioides sp.]|nr:MDR family MFS transporter [Nocardioides sp.]
MTTSADTRVSRASVGLRSERGPVLLAVMLSTGLVAIDATILAAAVPAVVRDLGGLSQFPWLFSVYLLAQAVTVPVYGKIADLVGRKPVMLFGIGVFVIGSLLCGIAWGMTSLIIFRAVQGIGAGAILPVSMTMVGDLYSLEERAKVQGYLASVWAMSAVVGPTLGGVFSDYLSWRWIFLVNLPIGLAAAAVLLRRFTEQVVRRRHKIDFAGASLLTVGGVLLLLGLLEGGVEWEWDSVTSISVLTVAVVLLVAFAVVERRAAEPVLPAWVFRHRVLNVAAANSLLVGVLLMGLTSYVPLYAQAVLGHGALVAGLTLATLTIGWPIAASTSGRFYLSRGFRFTTVLGAVLTVAGGALLLFIDPHSSLLLLGGACFVLGLGFGYVASPSVVAVQQAVGWQSRGVATGANMFARSVGSAVGVAIFGAVANAVVTAKLGGDVSRLGGFPPAVLDPAITAVFGVSAALSLLLLVVTSLMPQRVQAPRT